MRGGSLDRYYSTAILRPSRRDILSPVQKLFGRPIQDTLPAHHRAFAQEWQRDVEETDKQAHCVSEYVEQHYNRHAFSLPDINIGSNMAIQNPITKDDLIIVVNNMFDTLILSILKLLTYLVQSNSPSNKSLAAYQYRAIQLLQLALTVSIAVHTANSWIS